MKIEVKVLLSKQSLEEILDRLEELIDKISDSNYRLDNAKILISSIRNGEEIKEERNELNKWYLK